MTVNATMATQSHVWRAAPAQRGRRDVHIRSSEGKQMKVRQRAHAALAGVFGLFLSPAAALLVALPQAARGDVITSWNKYLLEQVIRPDNKNPPDGQPSSPEFSGDKPPAVSRQLAMIHGAMFDAVNTVERRYRPYLAQPTGFASANAEVAAIWAAHDVAAKVFETSTDQIRSRITSKRNSDLLNYDTLGTDVLEDSRKLGQEVARQMLANRANDRSGDVVPYLDDAPSPGSTTSVKTFGRYRMDQFSNGAQVPAAASNWGLVTPFAMTRPDQFRKNGPPAFTGAQYADLVQEVRRLGDKRRYDLGQYSDPAERAAVAKDMRTAFFWAEKGLSADGTKTQAGTITPPGHWNEIASTASAGRNLTLSENARMYAILNIAMADAAIAAWDMKYHYDLWRPIHAIRLAATDPNDPNFNPGLLPKPGDRDWATWLPLIPTSNHPEYVSGHSTFSGAAAEVLTALLGRDVNFTISADDAMRIDANGMPDPNGIKETRTYTNFWDAAQEASRSRIFGGIHYTFSGWDGLDAGRDVGGWTINSLMAPVPEPVGASTLLALAAIAGLRRRRRR